MNNSQVTVSRRSLLKTGAMGGAFLTVGSSAALLTGCAKKPPQQGFAVLREQDVALLSAIAPVVLAGALPTGEAQKPAIAELMQAIDGTLTYSSLAAQKTFAQLFDLLSLPPARILTTGVWSSWADASHDEVEAFLARWENSSISLFRAGYFGLVKVLTAAWYALPNSWSAIGYVAPIHEV